MLCLFSCCDVHRFFVELSSVQDKVTRIIYDPADTQLTVDASNHDLQFIIIMLQEQVVDLYIIISLIYIPKPKGYVY